MRGCVSATVPGTDRGRGVVTSRCILTGYNCGMHLTLYNGRIIVLVPCIRRMFRGSCLGVSNGHCCVCPGMRSRKSFHSYRLPGNTRLNGSVKLEFANGAIVNSRTGPFECRTTNVALRNRMPANIVPLLSRCPVVSVPAMTTSMMSGDLHSSIIGRVETRMRSLNRRRTTGHVLQFVRVKFPCTASSRRFRHRGCFCFRRDLCCPGGSYRSHTVFCTCLMRRVLKLSMRLVRFAKRRYATMTFRRPMRGKASCRCGNGGFCVYSPACVKTGVNGYVPDCTGRSPRVRM